MSSCVSYTHLHDIRNQHQREVWRRSAHARIWAGVGSPESASHPKTGAFAPDTPVANTSYMLVSDSGMSVIEEIEAYQVHSEGNEREHEHERRQDPVCTQCPSSHARKDWRRYINMISGESENWHSVPRSLANGRYRRISIIVYAGTSMEQLQGYVSCAHKAMSSARTSASTSTIMHTHTTNGTRRTLSDIRHQVKNLVYQGPIPNEEEQD